jgi:uncharacterized protein (DUF427 family)
MGLSWQQGPLAPGAAGRFLVPDPLPERLLYAEPLRRRMRVRFGGAWAESGFAPRWYVPRADIDQTALAPATEQTFCPYKGLCSYYDIRAARAAWSYRDAYTEVGRIGGLISFEPDLIEVHIDGARLRLEPGQSVIPHVIDWDLATDAAISGKHP